MNRELIMRLVAPAAIIVVEVEAPTRITTTATPAEADRLAAWIETSPARDLALAWALAAREDEGGVPRQQAWSQTLREAGGGVVAAIEDVLRSF